MWNPFRKKAASGPSLGYEGQVLDAVETASVTGRQSDLVAAQVTIENAYGRLAECTVTGGPDFLNREVLHRIGRDVAKYGCSRLANLNGEWIRPDLSDRIKGGWSVTIHEGGDKSRTLRLLEGEVWNFVFRPHPQYPWRGIPVWSSETSELARNLDQSMAGEAKAVSGQMLHASFDAGSESDAKSYVRAVSRTLNRRESRRGQVGVVAYTRSLKADLHRYGPSWPDSLEKTRAQLFREICASSGVPAEMVLARNGGSTREARREFSMTMQALANRLADHMTDFFLVKTGLSASPLNRIDLISRSRALNSLRKAQVPLPQAMRICGFVEE